MDPDEMPFPSEYREAILSGEKTMTHRVSAEMGKYKADRIYKAVSEDRSDPWSLIYILSIERIPIEQAPECARKMADGPEAEVIRFKLVA